MYKVRSVTARPRHTARLARWLAPSVLALVLGAGSAAAGSATTTANVTIFSEPLTFTEAAQLRFGSLASGVGGGTVTVDASEDAQRIATGTVRLLGRGNFGPATFAITGQAGATYSIGLPNEVAIMHDNSSKPTLTADNLTSFSKTLTVPGPAGQIGVDGSDTLFVGATLHMPADAAQGNYRGEVELVINYD